MRGLQSARMVIQKLTYLVCAVSMFALLPLMLLTTTDVITRSFFSRPLSGVVELSSFMLTVVILLGIAYTQQVKGHPTVTLVVSRFPDRVQALIQIVTSLLSLIVVAIIIWQGWVLATGDVGRIVSAVLKIPQYFFRMLVPVGGVLLFLEILIDMSDSVGKLAKNR